MRTQTLRGLAAGAGAAAIMLSGAATATAADADSTSEPPSQGADSDQNQTAYWEAYFMAEGGYSEVWCDKDEEAYQGDTEYGSLYISQDDFDLAAEGGWSWVGIVIKAGTENAVYTDLQGDEEYVAPDGKAISHVIVCGGYAEEGEPTPTDDTDTDDSTGTPDDGTDGPAVETDGPTETAGPNAGLIGGAALALAGAGAAAWAMRRRPESR